MIYSKKALIISLLLTALPLCGVPAAKGNKNAEQKQPLKQSSMPLQAVQFQSPLVITMTTAQIMQQGRALAVNCTPALKQSKQAAKPSLRQTGPTVDKVFPLATYQETGAELGRVDGALGEAQGLLVMDSRIRSFCKITGAVDQVLDISVDQFFSAVNNGYPTLNVSTLFDPNPQVPGSAGNWYILANTQTTDSAVSRLILAVGADPITLDSTWTFIVIDNASNPLFNTPKPYFNAPFLGLDNSFLYISLFVTGDTNLFYASSALYVLPKPITGTPKINAFYNIAEYFGGAGCGNFPGCANSPVGLQPAINFDTDTTGYVLSITNADYFASQSATYGTGTQGQLLLQTVDTVASPMTLSLPTPIFVDAFVSPQPVQITAPANAPAVLPVRAISSALLLGASHKRNNVLYYSQLIGSDNTGASTPTTTVDRNAVRWYAITNPRGSFTVTTNMLFDSSATFPVSYFGPSLMIDANSNIIIGATTNGLILGSATGFLSSTVTQVTGGYQSITPTQVVESITPYYPTEDWFGDPHITWSSSRTTIDTSASPVSGFWPFIASGFSAPGTVAGIWGVATAQITPGVSPQSKK